MRVSAFSTLRMVGTPTVNMKVKNNPKTAASLQIVTLQRIHFGKFDRQTRAGLYNKRDTWNNIKDKRTQACSKKVFVDCNSMYIYMYMDSWRVLFSLIV